MAIKVPPAHAGGSDSNLLGHDRWTRVLAADLQGERAPGL
jgi:hypothetical protein